MNNIFIAFRNLWTEGSTTIRGFLILTFLLIITAYSMYYFLESGLLENSPFWTALMSTITVICLVLTATLYGIALSNENNKSEQKIIEVEKRYEANPQVPQAAWDLARVKLERYLDRNLGHVRWIFILTVLVMLVGFGLIVFGISQVYGDTDNLNASIVAAISGILTNFIGVTFLIIYKSTMSQAKEYVTVLERINAVGMAVQILETLDDTDENKSKSTSEIAKQLLQMYTISSSTGNG